MKKLVIVGLLVLAGFGFVNAQTATQSQDITVSANVGKHVYILSAPNLALGTLDVVTGGSDTDTAMIRSNHSSWTFKVYAEKGVLTQWNGTTYVTGASVTTIPYTFTFNSAATVATEKIVAQTVPTVAATAATTATFTAKTTGGVSGQAFVYGVNVVGIAAGADWDAANYQDVLHVTVAAN